VVLIDRRVCDYAEAFVHRYGKLVRWDAAGRPVLVLFVAFLVQKSLRRRYLSWKESSSQVRVQAAAVTVQSAARAMAARRELSLRRQARAATRIQVAAFSGQRSTSLLMSAGSNFPMCWKKKAQWRAHQAMWSYLMTKRAALICQFCWRQSIARKQLVKLRLVLPALLLETSTAHGFLVFAA
jgi:hypothetical protein